MAEIFLNLLNMSISAGWLILAVPMASYAFTERRKALQASTRGRSFATFLLNMIT